MSALKIRLANIDDMKKVFDLSNDDVVRQNSFNSSKILWEDHEKWFKNRISRVADEPFYIVEDENGNFAGQTRFDKKNGEIVISVSIAEAFRGKGLAGSVIKLCTEKTGFETVFAYIKESNISSVRAFRAAGYVPDLGSYKNEGCVRLVHRL